jgi:mutator protein MutT
VSVKGVVQDRRGVLLALNDRNEWELPGGQLEEGETPEQCVVREIREETSLLVTAGRLLDAWVFEVIPGREVLILAYACDLATPEVANLRASAEHSAIRFVGWSELAGLTLPAGYRRAIHGARLLTEKS